MSSKFTGSSKTKQFKKRMVEAMQKTLGIVSSAEKVAGITRATHYDWLKKDPEYKAAIDEVSESVVDFAESQLYQKIRQGDTASLLFFMKCKAKNRGYVERQEIAGVPDQPVELNVILGSTESAKD